MKKQKKKLDQQPIKNMPMQQQNQRRPVKRAVLVHRKGTRKS